jgi:hypothetical protein
MNERILKPSAFSSAVSKVKWANQHIRNMEVVLKNANETSANTFIAREAPDTKGAVTLIANLEPILRWSPVLTGMTGDALHNLRSALDHLAWPISWDTLSPGVTLEWRGVQTVEALRILRANGALG